MAEFSRTWWGQRFIAALEQFTDPGRLGRGRSYAHNGKILAYMLAGGTVRATVRGSTNPYYGVYTEPRYKTTITLKPIAAADWAKVIARIGSRADLVTRLLLSEMPETIEEAFSDLNLHLLPHNKREFATTCSCPDYENPCKHIAGVYYRLAADLDRNPFVMFELRGLSRDDLHAQLTQSPLGKVLASALTADDVAVQPVESYRTHPATELATAEAAYKEFWTGARRLPAPPAPPAHAPVPALLVKKQGDYPPFWPKDASFIAVMEELYERVRTKNKLTP